MEVSGLRVGRRSTAELDRLLAAATGAPLSYGHVGTTLSGGAPAGVPDRTFSQEVSGSLDAARRTLRGWAPHSGIRARIHPPDAAVTEGSTLLVVAPFGPVEMCVPDRVVRVLDEPCRFGFAYGTLTGHAEAGEECFLAEALDDGRIRLSVRVQARPATRLARLGAPVLKALQAAAARRYLRAWTTAIQEGEI